MVSLRRIVLFLFFPAVVGLLIQIIQSQTLAERLFSLALALFCPELARMARVDLDNIVAVEQKGKDSRLSRFHFVVSSTVVLELAGFYIALFSLPAGGLTIVFSQLWFNTFAGIQLWPQADPAIVTCHVRDRIPVIGANVLAFALLATWFVSASAQVWLSLCMVILVVLYLTIKYLVPGTQPAPPPKQP